MSSILSLIDVTDFWPNDFRPNGLISPGIKLFSSACRNIFSSKEKFVSMTPVSGDDSVLAAIGSSATTLDAGFGVCCTTTSANFDMFVSTFVSGIAANFFFGVAYIGLFCSSFRFCVSICGGCKSV